MEQAPAYDNQQQYNHSNAPVYDPYPPGMPPAYSYDQQQQYNQQQPYNPNSNYNNSAVYDPQQ